MSKAIATKNNILTTALLLVRRMGFESVSIGKLAAEVGMSKSGLFAHFQSKEKMHLMILDYAAKNFTDTVIKPAIKHPRGLPRLKSFIQLWIDWYGEQPDGTCPFVAAGVEYDQKPGVVKKRLQTHLNGLISSLAKAIEIATQEGQLKSDSNSEQLAYQIYSLMVGAQIYHRTLERRDAKKRLLWAIDFLLKSYSTSEVTHA